MSRRTLLATVTGLTLVGALAAPALAGPLPTQDRREGGCIRLDPDENSREGICAYVPITLPID